MSHCNCAEKYGPLINEVTEAYRKFIANFYENVYGKLLFRDTLNKLNSDHCSLEETTTIINNLKEQLAKLGDNHAMIEILELRRTINNLPTTSAGEWVDTIIVPKTPSTSQAEDDEYSPIPKKKRKIDKK